ncbi:Hypothetical predicted protein [Cloeon dipterum]|uniref:Bee-milk protein n=1 Tax=Cloeon dipterum TaxID=197152 RepID=A0A8S1D186_9INSE|nr:Hypothetical predicted protein [Cloeon dipterum]
MAVFGRRIFLSFEKFAGIPVTLVSLPTSSDSYAPPKLTPFPSWDLHMHDENGDCNKIEVATGLEVDSVGRLWVLDDGGNHCNTKLWIFDLTNKDQTKLIHHFPFHYNIHDLVLDETPNETLAYIARWGESDIVVFSLERKLSWILSTPGIEVSSIALSPKNEPRQLYFSKYNSTELYSIPVSALCKGTGTANPEVIGNWTARPYRMLMDNQGTIYAAFREENHIHSWNTSQPHQEQYFYKVGKLYTLWPFCFSLDSSGIFWMFELNKTAAMPRYRLLKAAVGVKSYISDSTTTGGRVAGKGQTYESALIDSLAFLLVLSCFIILWLSLRIRKSKKSNKQRDAGAIEMETLPLPNSVSQEMVVQGFENVLYSALHRATINT